jgi:two-component system response regulator AtoC
MPRILIVDDDPRVLYMLKELMVERGHEPVTASSGRAALEACEGVDAVLTDLAMPEMNGLELLQALRERDRSLPVILLTAQGSEKLAVQAIRGGAYDYLTKPADTDELTLVIDRALETRRLRVAVERHAAERALGRRIIGDAPPMPRLLDAVARVAGRDITVLVHGETGTGKELVAGLLHVLGRRASMPYVRFNCAALPGELADAELFGHAKGAFTGAHGARRGFFAQAHGGTLLIDEVGELPLPIQAKLLRALQEGEIQPVGSGQIEKVDVRVVASTNRDLLREAKAGRFREDLYYRLAVLELVVPPLRERREDIPALCVEIARRYADKFGLEEVSLSPELVRRLQVADWPGNIRQLENTVARLVALSPGGPIDADAFEGAPAHADAPAADALGEDRGTPELGPSLREQMEAFERSIVARALSASGGNQSEAARRLSMSRVTLLDKLKKYGLGSPKTEA